MATCGVETAETRGPVTAALIIRSLRLVLRADVPLTVVRLSPAATVLRRRNGDLRMPDMPDTVDDLTGRPECPHMMQDVTGTLPVRGPDGVERGGDEICC